MSNWNNFDNKTCMKLIKSRYHHMFSMRKKEFCKFLSDFSLTQLKGHIKHQNEKEVKKTFKLPLFCKDLIEVLHL